MANRVYTKTHHGLTNMVSARAASKALDNALRGKGATPETVDVALMKKLLLGPILQEFKGILPPTGLRHNLRELADSLTDTQEDIQDIKSSEMAEPTLGDPDAPPTESDHVAKPSTEPDIRVTPTPAEEPRKEVPVAAASAPSRVKNPRLAAALSQNPQRPQSSLAGKAKPAKPEPQRLTPQQLEHMVLSFAQLEQVNLVAALDRGGDIITVRGSGIDIPALSRLGLTGLKLLSRSGRLRSYYLAHPRGQLFLFPIAQTTLVVVGSAELNVGAVFNTITTLKEEL